MPVTTVSLLDLTSAIGRAIRQHRASLMNEMVLHDAIASALDALGIEYHREHSLGPGERLDFWLPAMNLCIEVKKRNAGLADLRQVGRYFEHAEVRQCLLVANRIAADVPAVFAGKPVHRLELWKYLL